MSDKKNHVDKGKALIEAQMKKMGITGVEHDIRQLIARYILYKGLHEAYLQCAAATWEELKKWRAEFANATETAKTYLSPKIHELDALQQKMAQATLRKDFELKNLLKQMRELDPAQADGFEKINMLAGEPTGI